MPTISNQYYGAVAANAAAGIQNAAFSGQGLSRSQQPAQGNPPYRVELSQASVQAQSSLPKNETVSPELLKALNNDVTRTGTEMSRAITDNHLHIAGLLSDDASSSFNFFGVEMPLAEDGVEFPKVQTSAPAADSSTAGSVSGTAPRLDAENRVEQRTAGQAPDRTENDTSVPGNPPAESAVRHDTEVQKNVQEHITQQFDHYSAQLSGMAMAATASPAQTAVRQ